jgi:hypothetical protein
LLDILAKNIRLKIDPVAGATCLQVRDLTGVRNDPNAKPISMNASDGQADSINGDGAFLNDVPHDRWRCFDVEHVILALTLESPDFSTPVDVTEHKVAVKPCIRAERAFEIHQGTFLHEFKIRPLKSFVKHIKSKRASASGNHGQTRAVDGHAVPNMQRLANPGGANRQFR